MDKTSEKTTENQKYYTKNKHLSILIPEPLNNWLIAYLDRVSYGDNACIAYFLRAFERFIW